MSDLEPHLLVVDDDARLRELLRRYLSENGFRVTTAADAAEARAKLASFAFDLIVLDVMMPGENGLELDARACAREGRIPILLLTAMAEPEDRVNGLEQRRRRLSVQAVRAARAGAADSQHAAARAARPSAGAGAALWRLPLRSRAAASCSAASEPVHLTAAEAALLARAGAATPGEPVTREELSLSAQFSGNVRNVDVQMTRLRRKIERDPRFPRYLQTVRGTGYVLKPD